VHWKFLSFQHLTNIIHLNLLSISILFYHNSKTIIKRNVNGDKKKKGVRKIERRKIKKKKKIRKKLKNWRKRNSYSLSLPKKKKVKTTLLPSRKPPPSLSPWFCPKLLHTHTPIWPRRSPYFAVTKRHLLPIFWITASFLNWHLLFLTDQHSSTNDNSVPCRTDARALSISGSNR